MIWACLAAAILTIAIYAIWSELLVMKVEAMQSRLTEIDSELESLAVDDVGAGRNRSTIVV